MRAVGTAIARDHPVVHVLANNAGALTAPRRALIATPEQGADTLVWLATAPGQGIEAGGYYASRASFPAAPWSTGRRRAARLWDASAQRVGATMPYSWILR